MSQVAVNNFLADAPAERQEWGDRYLAALCGGLFGYSMLGKGFAYWGFAPLFVGEMLLLSGLFIAPWSRRGLSAVFSPMGVGLLLFQFLGLAQTLPYIGTYGVDALRDAAVWGYSIFALVVADLIADDPRRLRTLLLRFRRMIPILLMAAPLLSIIAALSKQDVIPSLPWAPNVDVIEVKGGDLLVQLTGAFAFLAVLGCEMPMWIPLLFYPLTLALNLQGRAGLVTFCTGFLLVAVFKPFNRLLGMLSLSVLAMVFMLWITQIHIQFTSSAGRDLSFDQLCAGMQSVVGESQHESLDGSKEWRLKWWKTIREYTLHGPYFWTGKGYGINLADDDGFTVDKENMLRNPHNVHMTFLARGGVPALSMWILIQGGFALSIAYSYWQARRLEWWLWSDVFLMLGIFWAAFMINASLDVFLEGPMGAVWFWTVYGTGLGAMEVFRVSPEVMHRPLFSSSLRH
jgi:hypothetical protein